MPDRGPIDKFFDVADGAMDALEGVLGEAPAPPPRPSQQPDDFIDAESRDVSHSGDLSKEWDATWSKELHWAMAGLPNSTGEAFHVFEEANLRAICGAQFRSSEIRDRQKLVHGKRIIACTSCIIAVSRRG